MSKVILPPCPKCDGRMVETDIALYCDDCGEEQPFAYAIDSDSTE